jgi:hypothetical protein
VCTVDIVNTPEMRVQKDYAFNLALLEIKHEAARAAARILSCKKYTLRSVMFIQHVAFLFPPKIQREGCARIYYFALIKYDVARAASRAQRDYSHTRLSFSASFEKNNPSVSLLMNISGIKGHARDKGPGCEPNPVKEFISRWLAGAAIHPDALVTSVKQCVKHKINKNIAPVACFLLKAHQTQFRHRSPKHKSILQVKGTSSFQCGYFIPRCL